MGLENIEVKDVLELGKLWILAERTRIPELQNTIIDALYPILWHPDVIICPKYRNMKSLLKIVYGENREKHPMLRSLLVDHFASLKPRQLNPWVEFLPNQLLVPLTRAFCKDREDSQGKSKSVLATGKEATDYYVEEFI